MSQNAMKAAASAPAGGAKSAPSRPRNTFAFFLYRVPLVMKILGSMLNVLQFWLLRFYCDRAVVNFITRLYKESHLLLQPFEAHLIYGIVKMQSRLPGDMAEVGTYRGASAKIICTLKGRAHFYGFDTFEGLPDVGSSDTHWGVRYFKSGQFAAPLDAVRAYLAEFPDCHLVPGLFPDSGGIIRDRRFSFVHLDTDLYSSTIDGLRFFWDRMVPGGIIAIHDAHAEGVSRAIEEFEAESGASGFTGTLSLYLIPKAGYAGRDE